MYDTHKTSSRSKALNQARQNKADEFYTRLEDIERELQNYSNHFQNKTVFCNADNPFESNFVKYFIDNFNTLGLKRLIAIGYSPDWKPFATLIGPDPDPAYKAVITHVPNNYTGTVTQLLRLPGNHLTTLKRNGDFRSPESTQALQEADIVVTNPPFSLFTEHFKQVMDHGKDIIVLGPLTALTNQELVPYVVDGTIRAGVNSKGHLTFRVPHTYPDHTIGKDGHPESSPSTMWVTTLQHGHDRPYLPLTHSYYDNPNLYPTYDNYDAIEVSRAVNIPHDYSGVMGVPISFFRYYNPNQFDIIDVWRHGYLAEQLGISKTTAISNGTPRLTNGPVVAKKALFSRLLIKNKHPTGGHP